MEGLVFQNFGVAGSGVPPLLKRIEALKGTLYRCRDVATGRVQGGAFMFQGIATNVHVPNIYGLVASNIEEAAKMLSRTWFGYSVGFLVRLALVAPRVATHTTWQLIESRWT